MKRSAMLAVATFAVVACQDASAPNRALKIGSSTAALVTAAKPIPGSYIVVMRDAVANVDGEVDQIGQQYGTRATYRYRAAIKGFAGRLSPAAVAALRNDPRIAYIEEDQEVHVVGTQPNPPSWGLDRIDQVSLPLNASYTYNQTGAGVDAYIIDTGIRTTHQDFGGRAVAGYDAVTAGGTAADGNGHGTHVAGTVGGTTYGVAKGVHLVAVRVLDNSGSGTTAGVIAGIDWVTTDHTTRLAVANMSLGGGVSTALDDAVRRSIADGVVYAIAAGNSSADASTASPARVAEAITVGATDINDGFASFSNYGPLVDILAPGVDITSAWRTSDVATNTISGTSMATPHVAGAAALYREANPAATPAQVQSGLIAAASTNKITGVPSGTANRLLYALFGAPPPPPPPPAAPTLSSPGDAATGVPVPAPLSWTASSGAASYTAQVSTSSSFATFAYNVSGITGTSTNATGLAASTVYFWRVSAQNAGGSSAFSATRSFTTASAPPPPPPPAAPVLSSPANAATGVAVPATLSWAASSGATSYNVQVSTSSTFGTLFLDRPGVTTTSTSVSGLAASTVYYWRVSATNSGGTSAFSAARSFTTAAAACTNGNCQN
jgi:subtilisin family serine protease